jgi:hypothetical protein
MNYKTNKTSADSKSQAVTGSVGFGKGVFGDDSKFLL